MQRSFRFPDRCILRYLQEYVSCTILCREYDYAVGRGTFRYHYSANRIINASNIKQSKKQKLLLILKLIAQTRHVTTALRRFMRGFIIRHNGQNVRLRGCYSTFIKYLKELWALDINPVLIPNNHCIRELKNPRQQIIFPRFS